MGPNTWGICPKQPPVDQRWAPPGKEAPAASCTHVQVEKAGGLPRTRLWDPVVTWRGLWMQICSVKIAQGRGGTCSACVPFGKDVCSIDPADRAPWSCCLGSALGSLQQSWVWLQEPGELLVAGGGEVIRRELRKKTNPLSLGARSQGPK